MAERQVTHWGYNGTHQTNNLSVAGVFCDLARPMNFFPTSENVGFKRRKIYRAVGLMDEVLDEIQPFHHGTSGSWCYRGTTSELTSGCFPNYPHGERARWMYTSSMGP